MLEFLEESTNPDIVQNQDELTEYESRTEFAAIYSIILKEQGRLNSESIQLYNEIISRYLKILSRRFLKNPNGDQIE